MSEELPEPLPKRKFSAVRPKPSRAYKDRYEAVLKEKHDLEMRVKIAVTLLNSDDGKTCEGNVLNAAINLLVSK